MYTHVQSVYALIFKKNIKIPERKIPVVEKDAMWPLGGDYDSINF